jgi:hypothetical protein
MIGNRHKFAQLLNDNLHPTDLTARKTHLDAAMMGRGVGENILNKTLGQAVRALIFLEGNGHGQTRIYVGSSGSIHIN